MVVKKNNKKGKITIDKLALMVANGFSKMEAKMATKEDLKRMTTKQDLKDLEERMNGKFEGINKRIDDMSITRVKYTEHKALVKRVEALEKA